MGIVSDQLTTKELLNRSAAIYGTKNAHSVTNQLTSGKIAGFIVGNGATVTINSSSVVATDPRTDGPTGTFACSMAISCKDIDITTTGDVLVVLG